MNVFLFRAFGAALMFFTLFLAGCSPELDTLQEDLVPAGTQTSRGWSAGQHHAGQKVCGCDTLALVDDQGRTEDPNGNPFGKFLICNDSSDLLVRVQLGRNFQIDSIFLSAYDPVNPGLRISATRNLNFRNLAVFRLPLTQLPSCHAVDAKIKVARVTGFTNQVIDRYYRLSPVATFRSRCNYSCCFPFQPASTNPQPHHLHGPPRCGNSREDSLFDMSGNYLGQMASYPGPDSLVFIFQLNRSLIIDSIMGWIGVGTPPVNSGGGSPALQYPIQLSPKRNYWVYTYPISHLSGNCFGFNFLLNISRRSWSGTLLNRISASFRRSQNCIPGECCHYPISNGL